MPKQLKEIVRMYTARQITNLFFCVALAFLSAGVLFFNSAWAQEPDFGNVEDILGGRGKLLAADDIVVQRIIPSGVEIWQANVMLTSDLKVSSDLVAYLGNGCEQPTFTTTKVGRVYDNPYDVTVSYAPWCLHGGNASLQVTDPTTSYEGVLDTVTTAFNLPAESTWMALGDFDGDNFDEVLLFSPVPVTLTVFKPKNLTDYYQGLEKVATIEFLHPVPLVSAPYSDLLVADLNGDGNLEVAWVDGGLVTMTSNNITFPIRIVTICGGNLSASGGACSGKTPYTVIEAPTIKVDVDTVPHAFDRFLAVENVLLTAGNYDGKITGPLDAELFVALIAKVHSTTGHGPSEVDTLIPLAYDFDQDLNAAPSPSNDWSKDPTLIIDNTNVGGWTAVDSGRLNWFRDADQVILAGTGHTANTFFMGTLTFGDDLSMNHIPYSDFTVPGITGVVAAKIGRFNPTSLQGPADFDQQIAVLYTKPYYDKFFDKYFSEAYVDIYAVDPSNNFKPSIASHTQVGHADTTEFPMVLSVGDLQGRSLTLGHPEIVRVSNHTQPSVVLGMPPSHVDWITPAGTSSIKEFNFSVVPAEYHASYETEVKQQNQSSRKGTTSYAFSTKEAVKESVSFGIPDIDSVTETMKFAAKQSHDGFVAKKYNTYETEVFDVSVQTLYGDQVWFTSSTFNVYYYPVLGRKSHDGHPLYVQFSGPDRIEHMEINGATLEWFQPVHEPGNVLSYPWDLAQLKLRNPRFSPYTSENPTGWATDSSFRVAHANWTEGHGSNVTAGQTSTHAFDASSSVSGKANFEFGSASGRVTLSLHTSKSLSTLNSQTQKLGESSGVGVTKEAEFKTPDLYQYSAQTFVYGQSSPVGTLQEIPIGTDFQGPGQLQTAFTADPTLNGGGWWQSGYPKPDVALNHPARWYYEGRNEQYEQLPANCLPVSGAVAEQCTVYNKPDPSEPWTSEFYWMKGLLITPSDANGAGPQMLQLREDQEVDLRVRLYNYSLTPMTEETQVHVRFYGQKWHGVAPVADAFLIDEAVVDPIPAFNDQSAGSIGKPNWAIAKASFTPSAAEAGKYLVFWVVTWMEDPSGKLVPEMPDHGLTALPGTLTDIGQAPIESYSNNVGLYKQALFVVPKGNSEEDATDFDLSGLVLLDLTVTPDAVQRYGRVEVRGVLRANGASGDNLSLFFYDGDPDQGGKAFDHEFVSHLEPDQSYSIAVPFQPTECGLRTIFVQIYPVDGAKQTLGTVDLDVCPPPFPRHL
jgi:hypothetical protein